MPCPYFEPQQIARNGQDIQGRLPLFDEYDGCCHAGGPARTVPSALRFSGCNHGHPDSGCAVFPAEEGRRQRRFHAAGRTGNGGATLEVIVLEIENYMPLRSRSVRYSRNDERLEPEARDACERAQILAFCRSYFRRFPDGGNL